MARVSLRKPLDSRASILMMLFCLVLGLQQVAMKAVAGDVGTLTQVAIRSSVALVLVLLVMWHQRIALFERGQLAPGLLMGVFYAVEFVCVAIGLNLTYASHMSVFLYVAPIFAAIGLHLFVPGEQLQWRHWLGVLIAFSGMILALAPSADFSLKVLAGDLLGLCAALFWAATTLILRLSPMAEAPSLRPAAYQLFVASLLLSLLAVGLGETSEIHMSTLAWASLGFQTVCVAFGVLLLWFWLLRRYLAWQLGVFSFLTPIFGIAFGIVLLNEPVRWNFMLGSAAILLGLVLISVRTRASSDN